MAPWPLMRLEHLFNNKMLSSTPRPFNVLRLPPPPDRSWKYKPNSCLAVTAKFCFTPTLALALTLTPIPKACPNPNLKCACRFMAKVNHEFQLYVTYFASMKTDKEKDRERERHRATDRQPDR